MFTNVKTLDSLTPREAAEAQSVELPTITIEPGAGVVGDRRIAVQIAITQYHGRMCGAHAATMGGIAHRLEVTRCIEFVAPDDPELDWLSTQLGKKSEDRKHRPARRLSLLMYQSPPRGLKNIKPWFQAYKQVQQAIVWARKHVEAARGEDKLAVIALLDIDEPREKAPDFKPAFDEAVVTGVMHVEIVRLAPLPTIDGFADPELDSEFSTSIEED